MLGTFRLAGALRVTPVVMSAAVTAVPAEGALGFSGSVPALAGARLRAPLYPEGNCPLCFDNAGGHTSSWLETLPKGDSLCDTQSYEYYSARAASIRDTQSRRVHRCIRTSRL